MNYVYFVIYKIYDPSFTPLSSWFSLPWLLLGIAQFLEQSMILPASGPLCSYFYLKCSSPLSTYPSYIHSYLRSSVKCSFLREIWVWVKAHPCFLLPCFLIVSLNLIPQLTSVSLFLYKSESMSVCASVYFQFLSIACHIRSHQ